MLLDFMRDTLRSLRAHALRFTLTSLGIVWGAFMLTYLSATMQGVDTHFTEELENVGPRIVYMFPGSVIKTRVGERGARQIELEEDDVERIEALESLDLATPNLMLWAQIVRSGRTTKLLSVFGVDEDARIIRNFRVAKGRFIEPGDVSRSARVAFIGAETKQRLFGEAPALGESIQIESVRFRVIGVAESKGDQLMNMGGRDDRAVLIPYTTAQRWLLRHDRVEQVVFAPQTREGSWETIGHARQVLSLHHRFQPDLDTALHFINIYDILQILHRLFFGLRIFLISSGLITLVVGAVGVMNIMLVVVGERTREIGLRKAVGAPSRSIFLQFLGEAVVVCGLSGVFGAGLGMGFTQLVAAVAPPESGFTSPPVLDPWTVSVLVVSLTVVGIIAGVMPAVRAARVEPSEALRSL